MDLDLITEEEASKSLDFITSRIVIRVISEEYTEKHNKNNVIKLFDELNNFLNYNLEMIVKLLKNNKGNDIKALFIIEEKDDEKFAKSIIKLALDFSTSLSETDVAFLIFLDKFIPCFYKLKKEIINKIVNKDILKGKKVTDIKLKGLNIKNVNIILDEILEIILFTAGYIE